MSTRPTRARLVARAGQTYGAEAGFTLRDKPAPLFQLATLAILLAKPISADLAVAACRELRRAGLTTPARMSSATWQHRVDALGRGHYRRFDESSATVLGRAADFVIERYRGDLRRLGEAAGHDRDEAARLLGEIDGIGPTGAQIFLREAQAVWPWLRPVLDDKVLDGARTLGLPHTVAGLTRWLGPDDPTAAVSALVRAGLDDEVAARVRADG